MSDIAQGLVNLVKSDLVGKTFASGSKGFHASGKITTDEGRFQAQAQAVLIGSKNNPDALAAATAEEMRVALTGLVEQQLEAKTFRTGRSGFYAQGKVDAHGQRYQVSAQAVHLS